MLAHRSLVFAALLVTASGCGSISDSISSPFIWLSHSIASSSRSSSPARRQSYRDEVRDYTAAYVKTSADPAAFQRGLASIAARHGVANWEADDDTFVAIGQGLRKAKLPQAQLEVWKTNLSNGDPGKAAAMQRGYDAGG